VLRGAVYPGLLLIFLPNCGRDGCVRLLMRGSLDGNRWTETAEDNATWLWGIAKMGDSGTVRSVQSSRFRPVLQMIVSIVSHA
jgi:hypothetical protein